VRSSTAFSTASVKLGHSPYLGSMSGFAESGHGAVIIRSERMLCRETCVNDIFAPSDV
jgi:hypothetical protein